MTKPLFVALSVNEKYGGHWDGATPDYRAFLIYKTGTEEHEIRGYGPDAAKASEDAWDRFMETVKEYDHDRPTIL